MRPNGFTRGDAIAAHRPFLAALSESAGRSPAVGVWPAWNRDAFADHGAVSDWLGRNESMAALRRPYVLAELGLPIAYGPEGAAGTPFSGPLPPAFSAPGPPLIHL